ncbi:MAG: HAMP domain-containing protein [Candidatus Omnitrophica bacterium]|nr:HAMP domain-containing protein [Candidatus Omnitrophota bacterium]
MNSRAQNLRKQYYIDKTFQKRFITVFCVMIILMSIVAVTTILYLNRSTTTVAFEDLRITVKTTSDFIAPIIIQTLIVTTSLTAVAVLILTVMFSHKISGPLFNINREVEKMANGDLSQRVKIRSDDQLQHLGSSIDEMRESLRKRIQTLQKEWAQFEKQAGELTGEQLKRARKIKENLDEFKT